MGLVFSALTVFGILTLQDDIAKSAFNPEIPQLLPGAPGFSQKKSEKMSRRQKVLLFSGQPNGGKEETKGQLRTVTGVFVLVRALLACLSFAWLLIFCFWSLLAVAVWLSMTPAVSKLDSQHHP